MDACAGQSGIFLRFATTFCCIKNKQAKKQSTNKRNVYLNVDLSLSAICQLWLIKDKLDYLDNVMWNFKLNKVIEKEIKHTGKQQGKPRQTEKRRRKKSKDGVLYKWRCCSLNKKKIPSPSCLHLQRALAEILEYLTMGRRIRRLTSMVARLNSSATLVIHYKGQLYVHVRITACGLELNLRVKVSWIYF